MAHVRLQGTVCLDIMTEEHPIVENIHENVKLEKLRTYGKTERGL